HGTVVMLRRWRVVHRRVVAEQDHLHALQAHHAIGLRPAAVVADAHAEASAEKIPDAETEIARFEIAFLEMLEASVALVLGMTGQVDLAVLGDDSASLVD